MSATALAVVLSLFSAVAYAAAAVAQERLASRNPGAGMLRMLASGAWWWSVVLNAAAALLHVVALKYGPLTVVQPLGALTLVAAVPMGARVAGRRVSATEWRGTAYTLLGLAAILVTASGPAPDDVLSVPEALAVAGVTAAVIGLLARRSARPGLRHASASGFASGVASALTQTVTVAATDRSDSLLSVQVIGVALLVAAFAAGGLLLSQVAYRGGLGAPLAVVTLANPLAAAVIGLSLLGERLQGGATGILLALAGAGLAAWGVVLLSRVTPEVVAGVAGDVVVEEHAVVAAGLTGGHAIAGSMMTYEHGAAAGMADAPTVTADAVVHERAGAADAVGDAHAAAAAGHPYDDDHPVAAVLALEAAKVAPEEALMPRQPGPGHLTPL